MIWRDRPSGNSLGAYCPRSLLGNRGQILSGEVIILPSEKMRCVEDAFICGADVVPASHHGFGIIGKGTAISVPIAHTPFRGVAATSNPANRLSCHLKRCCSWRRYSKFAANVAPASHHDLRSLATDHGDRAYCTPSICLGTMAASNRANRWT